MIYQVQYTFANFTINFKTRQLKITRRRSVSSILGNQKKNERRRSFQKPRKRKKVPCYCNNYESINVDVHQTSTSGSDFGGYTESQRLQIELHTGRVGLGNLSDPN
ncbi:hypothetical protein GLOIN_2v1480991 [Rhizophagus irregularis DAOM 181602=DAOM 197198]|nr:hypothetical protein GLOIN_2v1480991 [Rhizophagus irregularis DAOM 181602=DAOM 197198]